MNDEKIKEIQQELKQLTQRQVELSKVHQQRVKSHEEQKTLYHHIFGQSLLTYFATLTSIGIVSKALWKSWNIKKAAELLEQGVESKGVKSELLTLSFHRHFSGLNNEQLKDEVILRRFLKLKALAVAGMLIGGFAAFVQLKNKNRFNK